MSPRLGSPFLLNFRSSRQGHTCWLMLSCRWCWDWTERGVQAYRLCLLRRDLQIIQRLLCQTFKNWRGCLSPPLGHTGFIDDDDYGKLWGLSRHISHKGSEYLAVAVGAVFDFLSCTCFASHSIPLHRRLLPGAPLHHADQNFVHAFQGRG